VGGIRLGPHFFNTEDEVRHAVSTLTDIVATGAYERRAGVPSLY
jgi:selenocysteine lyase/cysteine desulfurase